MKDEIKKLVKEIQTPSLDAILSDLTQSIPKLALPRLSALFQMIIKNVKICLILHELDEA